MNLLIRSSLCAFVVFLAACASKKDPCAGLSDACIVATIEGTVTGLDQLRITIDKPQAKTVLTPSAPHAFSLPVETAIIPPAGLMGQIQITVEGLSGGVFRAAAAPQGVTVPAAGHQAALTFTLVGPDANADLSGIDGSGDGGPDMPPGPALIFSPNMLSFPDTGRGMTASSMTVTLTNNTNTTLNIAGMPTPTGDAASFNIGGGTGTTCANMMMNFGPKQSCQLGVTFSPNKAGLLMSTFMIQVTGQPDAVLSMKGIGLRSWSDETVPSGPNWNGAHGSGPNDIYVVAQSFGGSVWHWDGAQWRNATSAGIGDQNLFSVFALDATHVWVGGNAVSNGISSTTNQGGNWTANSLTVSAQGTGFIRGLFAANAADLYGIEDNPANGRVIRSTDGINWNSYSAPLGAIPVTAMGYIMGGGSTSLLVCGQGGMCSYGSPGGSFMTSFTPSAATKYTGIWGDAKANKFYLVGSTSAAPFTYYVYSMTNGNTSATMELNTSTQLSGIGGHSSIALMPADIFVVGALGNQVYHSIGNGLWQLMPIPTNQAMSAVYADPLGDVVLAGYNGQIAHFH